MFERKIAASGKGSERKPGPRGFEAAYRRLLGTGELAERARMAAQHLEDCDLCARYCRINRRQTIRGAVCRTGSRAIVHSCGPHHGEEICLRGWRGSGTIFFSHCNLRCVFCQNWDISWRGGGEEVTDEALAAIMLRLQEQGCHNINFVSPSHVVAQILGAVSIAAERGLALPLVYNTGGYDSPEALGLLDGVIDIYMPDMKYGDSAMAKKYSHIRDYVEFNHAAVKEMHRQVGDLTFDEDGLARRGLLVRHLVLPNRISGAEQVVKFLVEEISPECYLNLMDQYRPCFKAGDYPEIGRSLAAAEYSEALALTRRYGLKRLDRRTAAASF
jgi:putative pyruvate formate lyase activating enzyme